MERIRLEQWAKSYQLKRRLFFLYHVSSLSFCQRGCRQDISCLVFLAWLGDAVLSMKCWIVWFRHKDASKPLTGLVFFFSLEYPAQYYRGLCLSCRLPATQEDMQLLSLVLYRDICEYQKRGCKFCPKTVCYSAKHLRYSAICQLWWWVACKGLLCHLACQYQRSHQRRDWWACGSGD